MPRPESGGWASGLVVARVLRMAQDAPEGGAPVCCRTRSAWSASLIARTSSKAVPWTSSWPRWGPGSLALGDTCLPVLAASAVLGEEARLARRARTRDAGRRAPPTADLHGRGREDPRPACPRDPARGRPRRRGALLRRRCIRALRARFADRPPTRAVGRDCSGGRWPGRNARALRDPRPGGPLASPHGQPDVEQLAGGSASAPSAR